MTYRSATLADVPALVAMGRAFLGELYTDVIPVNSAQMTTTVSNLIARDDGVILVAEHDGALVGMLGMLAFSHFVSGERTAGEVFWWVSPKYRGGPAGIRLLKLAEAWAERQGADRMQMVAPTQTVGDMYTRLGYQRVETTYHKPCVRMRKVV